VAIIGFVFPATGFAGKSDPAKVYPVIKILVYNITQAPGATLAGAEREAGRILLKAGVRASWFECPAGHSDTGAQAVCQNGWGPNNIGLRILVKPTTSSNRFQGDHLGFAVFPALASVYYDDNLRFTGDDAGLGLPMILGCFIAHEIGHLLLGSNSHSKQGVMQAEWEERQIHQALALAGDLLFTPEESQRIRVETQARIEREEDNLATSYEVAEYQHSAKEWLASRRDLNPCYPMISFQISELACSLHYALTS
jgi:hypothetical protein